jgi:hypothetical protein
VRRSFQTVSRNCLKSGSSNTSTANLVGTWRMRWAERTFFRRFTGPRRGWLKIFRQFRTRTLRSPHDSYLLLI